jgi:glutaredoxin-like YruB-family protein
MTEIEVFSTPSCPYCTKLKNWLEEEGYEFQEYDVSENKEKAREMMERTGRKGVPQTFVGDKEIVGFQPDEIRKAIEG